MCHTSLAERAGLWHSGAGDYRQGAERERVACSATANLAAVNPGGGLWRYILTDFPTEGRR